MPFAMGSMFFYFSIKFHYTQIEREEICTAVCAKIERKNRETYLISTAQKTSYFFMHKLLYIYTSTVTTIQQEKECSMYKLCLCNDLNYKNVVSLWAFEFVCTHAFWAFA